MGCHSQVETVSVLDSCGRSSPTKREGFLPLPRRGLRCGERFPNLHCDSIGHRITGEDRNVNRSSPSNTGFPLLPPSQLPTLSPPFPAALIDAVTGYSYLISELGPVPGAFIGLSSLCDLTSSHLATHDAGPFSQIRNRHTWEVRQGFPRIGLDIFCAPSPRRPY
jgi:hypothetical protein